MADIYQDVIVDARGAPGGASGDVVDQATAKSGEALMSFWSETRRICRRYWPWLVPIAFLVIYELVALWGPGDTLSALVWEAFDTIGHWFAFAVIIIAGVLMWHFFIQCRR